jgi:uncharacterized membrane protein (DUF2068 family)
MPDTQNQRTIGTSILAILTAQAGLLALFLSGSVFLQTFALASTHSWGLNGLMMLLIGVAYLVLAYGLWRIRRWAKWFSYVSLLTVLTAGIVNTLDNKMLDLGFALVFFLCCAVNFVIAAWFFLYGNRCGQELS